MVKTIGNPLSWGAGAVTQSASHIAASARQVGSADAAPPEVRSIGLADIGYALRMGVADMTAMRSDVLFIILLYPIMGLILVGFTLEEALVPLIFPLLAGLPLIGPVIAVGLYVMSRQREAGAPTSWADAFSILRAPALGPVVVLALHLFALFLVWMFVANALYAMTLGPEPPASAADFLSAALTTGPGIVMSLAGLAVGFFFAVAALAVSIVSFPLLVDRRQGVPVALATSLRVAARSPVAVGVWGLIVAVTLALGALPLLLGLIVVFPVLGHASWHLYRRAVSPAD